MFRKPWVTATRRAGAPSGPGRVASRQSALRPCTQGTASSPRGLPNTSCAATRKRNSAHPPDPPGGARKAPWAGSRLLSAAAAGPVPGQASSETPSSPSPGSSPRDSPWASRSSATSWVERTQSTSRRPGRPGSGPGPAKSARAASSFLSKQGITAAWYTGRGARGSNHLRTRAPITCCGDRTALKRGRSQPCCFSRKHTTPGHAAQSRGWRGPGARCGAPEARRCATNSAAASQRDRSAAAPQSSTSAHPSRRSADRRRSCAVAGSTP
mmetsp:Transcript_6603/g.22615  ORF Transcript_6603/g.22615 Transcript_6603/m.22615 type:complete len:269 (-) Transcript_6603:346-1152(-)